MIESQTLESRSTAWLSRDEATRTPANRPVRPAAARSAPDMAPESSAGANAAESATEALKADWELRVIDGRCRMIWRLPIVSRHRRRRRERRDRFRRAEWQRDPHCRYCGRLLGRKNGGTVDHIVPRSAGGRDTPTNWVLACRECNERKANLLPEEWYDELLRMAANVARLAERLAETGGAA